MTAVLDGMTPLAFVRGDVTIPVISLTPEDWVELIDEALFGLPIERIADMMPIGEILSRRYGGLRDVRHQTVSPNVLKKTVGYAPPGARFLHCNAFAPMAPTRSADLLLGKEFEKDVGRIWRLSRLEVRWRQMRPQELSRHDTKSFTATQITLHALSHDEVLDLFKSQDLNSVYLAGRSVLQRLYQAFDATGREAENYAGQVRARQRRVAGMLGRTGYGPFANGELAVR